MVADDLDYGAIAKADMFHFGYPPLMRRIFEQDGRELQRLFRRVKETGATTSLDMAQPDSHGRVLVEFFAASTPNPRARRSR